MTDDGIGITFNLITEDRHPAVVVKGRDWSKVIVKAKVERSCSVITESHCVFIYFLLRQFGLRYLSDFLLFCKMKQQPIIIFYFVFKKRNSGDFGEFRSRMIKNRVVRNRKSIERFRSATDRPVPCGGHRMEGANHL